MSSLEFSKAKSKARNRVLDGRAGILIGLPERSQVGRSRPSAKSCWTDGRLTLSWKPCFLGQPENVTRGGDGAPPAAVTGLCPKAARPLPTPLLGRVTQILWLSISLSVK